MSPNEEKTVARRATALAGLGLFVLMLLILDLLMDGFIVRKLRGLRSETTSTLPGERRTVGSGENQTELDFLT
jgi:hypothetical protein